jgi:precorrin-2 dehydrogenase/sirohydrochlorin ferrochelatase
VVATRKCQVLLDTGARLVVVAEHAEDILINLCAQHGAELVRSRYSPEYLSGALLAIAATNRPDLNRRIYQDCQRLEILCNVVDDPALCDFFVPAVVRRGRLQVAVGTDGYCPAYSGHLRRKLEDLFTDKHGEFLAELEQLRARIIKVVPDAAVRKGLLGRLVEDHSFECFCGKGPAAWRQYADGIIKESTRPS